MTKISIICIFAITLDDLNTLTHLTDRIEELKAGTR